MVKMFDHVYPFLSRSEIQVSDLRKKKNVKYFLIKSTMFCVLAIYRKTTVVCVCVCVSSGKTLTQCESIVRYTLSKSREKIIYKSI